VLNIDGEHEKLIGANDVLPIKQHLLPRLITT